MWTLHGATTRSVDRERPLHSNQLVAIVPREALGTVGPEVMGLHLISRFYSRSGGRPTRTLRQEGR